MKAYTSVLFLVTSLLIAGCDSDNGGSSSVSFQSATVFQNGQPTKALQLTDGSDPIELNWKVGFSSPSGSYQVRAYLGSKKLPQQRELFQRNCATSPNGTAYECGSEYTYACTIEYNAIDCRGSVAGKRISVDTPYDRITFEACVYDFGFESTDKTTCATKEVEFNTFYASDERLSIFEDQVPEAWRLDGIPGPLCESKLGNTLTGCYQSEACFQKDGTTSLRYWVDFLASGVIKTYQYEYPTDLYCGGAFKPIETTPLVAEYTVGATYEVEDADSTEDKKTFTKQVKLDVSLASVKYFSAFDKDGIRLCLPDTDYSWQYTGIGLSYASQDKDNRSENILHEDCLSKR